jgi:murein DD-endopeptidase MepM/ murein hydrolase activator NlpD
VKIIRAKNKKEDIFARFLIRTFLILILSGSVISDAPDRLTGEKKIPRDSGNIFLLSDMFSAIQSGLVAVETGSKFEGRIKQGENLAQILTVKGVTYPTVLRLFSEVRGVYDLELIHAGHAYGLKQCAGDLKEFWYEIDADRYLEVRRDDGGKFSAINRRIPYRIKNEIVRGDIGASLFQAILEAGEKPELADMLASLFEYDIDFNRDIREGDRFVLLVEKKYLAGNFIDYGHLLAAELMNAKKRIFLIRYTDPDGKTAYYHPDGRAVKKMFLRCPLPFIRLVSGYGFRLHPVLGFSAKHNGVDLAAPRGTKVRATADGVVSGIGSDAVRGKYIVVRHANGYASHYYHLYRFQSGIKAGISIRQSQIIGYVGRSGRTTGYHLHYGMMKNGRFINPMTLESPSLDPLDHAYLDDFKLVSSAVFFMLSNSRILDISNRLQQLFTDDPSGEISFLVSPLTY